MDNPNDIPEREVTDESKYRTRRQIMQAALLVGTAAATAWAYRKFALAPARPAAPVRSLAEEVMTPATNPSAGFSVTDPLTSFDDITHYNNFYEFSTDKDGVAPAAAGFVTTPWKVEVSGLVSKPKTFDIGDLLKLAPPEERIYRMRCVEAWSMVVPWDGFSLSKLLNAVEPLSSAKYVAFQTLQDPDRMPMQKTGLLNWPYVEGLRMDEAMHPLTLLASGLYGKQMPPQDGAPVRLIVPWKYGFKGIKSIVKIDLRAEQPPTTWSTAAPNEYGFYANVNPTVDHPRWSQAFERRISDGARQATLMFNGYGEQVASLYTGMDLRVNY